MFYPYYGFGYDPAYIALVLISLVLGMLTQAYINSTYKKWSRVPSGGESGEQVARRMLDANGCERVGIRSVSGHLTDHYDPRDNNLYLSHDNLGGGSVASVAVACHEAGDAAQREQGYFMMKVRHALVPVVNFTQNIWMLVFLLGVFMNVSGLTSIATCAVLVHRDLPSGHPSGGDQRLPARGRLYRAVRYGRGERSGARQVLTAAALTYVAAALTSVLQLLYILGRTRSEDE